MEKELICICGDSEAMHVDACDQCVIPGCGCQEFEEECRHPNVIDGVCDDCGDNVDTDATEYGA